MRHALERRGYGLSPVTTLPRLVSDCAVETQAIAERLPQAPTKDLATEGAMVEHFAQLGVWGVATSIDIYNCNPETIRDADKIRQFVVELCDLIQMTRYGDTVVVHFGEDERVAGYSMTQLIETSLISAHFANQTNTTYLDVFSCKPYDPTVVEEFAQRFFGGTHCIAHVNLRI